MTKLFYSILIFAPKKEITVDLNRFKIIAFTHKNFELAELGKLHIEESEIRNRLSAVKTIFGIDEMMLLCTCNRMEFLLSAEENFFTEKIHNFFQVAYPLLSKEEINRFIFSASVFEGEEALLHLFKVASSLDSLVVGEREIITQVRNAYELCRKNELSGDFIRLAVQKTIECAKQVYTETNIAKKPVSVVSLAYRKLKEFNIKLNAKFLIVGAGVTNTAMSKYLKKHGFTNFVVFNRTLVKAEKLAREIGGIALPLSEINNYKKGFDVIVTCTGSSENIITQQIYTSLAGEDKSRKVVIDLALPNDLDEEILKKYEVNLIAVNNLQDVANKNLKEREKELSSCKEIIEQNIEEFKLEFRERAVELAMKEIPKKVKEIRTIALSEVFAQDIEKLDTSSRETLDKIISYLEKKYISVPMKMAKEILLEKV